MQCVGLLDVKLGSYPRSGIKMKYENKTFLRRMPLSRFLTKTMIVNLPWKSSSENLSFGVDFNLLVPPFAYKKINAHSMSEKLGHNSDWRVVVASYVCVYVCMLFHKVIAIDWFIKRAGTKSPFFVKIKYQLLKICH